MSAWLHVERGEAPLVLAVPHAGVDLGDVAPAFRSAWLARFDADWWIDRVYAFATGLGATMIRSAVSRSVIDLNRDPSGASLYPGQATTGLCPTTTFDGVPLYADAEPDAGEVARRRSRWFDPYHDALAAEIARLRERHPHVVLYDAHSIRSRVPRLFDGMLPVFNIGTDGGTTCAAALRDAVARVCADTGEDHVVDGRFRGGWTTRHYGRPRDGVHAIQMELAMRAYLDEPTDRDEASWPPPVDPARLAVLVPTLRRVIEAALRFAASHPPVPEDNR